MKGTRQRASGEPVGAAGLSGTVVLHLAVLVTLLAAGTTGRRPVPPAAYRVLLVAAPRPATAAPPAAPAITGAVPPSAPAPAPTGRAVSTGTAPDRPSLGGDRATIRTEGVEFPFPGYLSNLVAQVYRRWRPPSADERLEAELFFFVHRDGSVTGLQFIRRSGSFAFDLEAQGAVEATARARAFGPLPDGYGPDVLPVSFFFNPRGLE